MNSKIVALRIKKQTDETENKNFFKALKGHTILLGVKTPNGEIQVNIPGSYGTYRFSKEESLSLFEIMPEKAFEIHIDNKKNNILEQTKRIQENNLLEDTQTETHNTPTEITTTNQNAMGALHNKTLELKEKTEELVLQTKNIQELLDHQKETTSNLMCQLQNEIQVLMEPIKAQIEKLNTAAHIANLYLGAQEAFYPIKEGIRAPETEPVCIRQRKLYIDEELALIHQNFNARKLSEFDELLKNPEVLNQLIAEPKGIIALQVRRKLLPDKEKTGNFNIDLQIQDENKQIYWIIKNGECLWRYHTNLEIGDTIFPISNGPISNNIPGSKEYYEEIKTAQKEQIVYLKICLLLQGILDRTQILTPFPNKEIPKLTHPDTWGNTIKLIRDAEYMLTLNYPLFQKWLETNNENTDVGDRIVTGNTIKRYHYNKKTTLEIFNDKPFTVFKNDRDQLSVKLPYEHHTYRARKIMRTIQPLHNVNYYINIDNANIEELKFYLHDRITKQNYDNYTNLIQQAIQILQTETKNEEPFINLLKNQVGPNITHTNITQHITAWKHKKRKVRAIALNINDTEAYNQILEEIKTTENIQYKQSQQDLDKIVEQIKNENTALIVQNSLRTFTSYELEQEDPNPIFFYKKEFRITKGHAQITNSDTTPQLIHIADRFHPRKCFENPDKTKNLPKITKLKPHKEYIQKLNEHLEEIVNQKNEHFKVVAILHDTKQQTTKLVFYKTKNYDIYADYINPYKPNTWKLTHNTRQISLPNNIKNQLNTEEFIQNTPNVIEYRDYNKEIKKYQIIYINKDALLQRITKITEINKEEERKEKVREYINQYQSNYQKFLEDKWEENEYHKFLKNGGNPTLFQTHLKTLIKPKIETQNVYKILNKYLSSKENITCEEIAQTPFEQIKKEVENYLKKENSYFKLMDWETIKNTEIDPNWKTPKPEKS